MITYDSIFPNESARSFPSCVQLTLVHYICDCACLSCPVGRLNRGDPYALTQWQKDGANRFFMSWQVFEKAVNEMGNYPHSFLRLHARGEPTLHPRFVDMVAHAKKAGVSTVQVFTNGLSMTEDLAREVIDTGLDVIEFSIHGHTRTYTHLMGNGRFEHVVENVLRFVRIRNELSGPTRVVVSAVDQPSFQPDKQAHRDFWRQHVDQVILRPYHSWGGRIPQHDEDALVLARRHPCPQLWTRLTVGPTGKVLFCFNSWDENELEVAGNLMDPQVTIASIWQSEHYHQVRAAHFSGNYTLGCCEKCTDWVGSAWGENSYEALLRKLKDQTACDNS